MPVRNTTIQAILSPPAIMRPKTFPEVAAEFLAQTLAATYPALPTVLFATTLWKNAKLFPTLNRVSAEIEGQIDHGKDTWGSLMAWAMFLVFRAEARKLREIGSDALLPRTVDGKIVEEKYYENLQSPEWSGELAEYRRS
jgi:hypothetical protein